MFAPSASNNNSGLIGLPRSYATRLCHTKTPGTDDCQLGNNGINLVTERLHPIVL